MASQFLEHAINVGTAFGLFESTFRTGMCSDGQLLFPRLWVNSSFGKRSGAMVKYAGY